jgi:hypothetical protein
MVMRAVFPAGLRALEKARWPLNPTATLFYHEIMRNQDVFKIYPPFSAVYAEKSPV